MYRNSGSHCDSSGKAIGFQTSTRSPDGRVVCVQGTVLEPRWTYPFFFVVGTLFFSYHSFMFFGGVAAGVPSPFGTETSLAESAHPWHNPENSTVAIPSTERRDMVCMDVHPDAGLSGINHDEAPSSVS